MEQVLLPEWLGLKLVQSVTASEKVTQPSANSGKHRLEYIPKLSHFFSKNKKGDISAARHLTLFTLPISRF